MLAIVGIKYYRSKYRIYSRGVTFVDSSGRGGREGV
jgi:hypothetical protein